MGTITVSLPDDLIAAATRLASERDVGHTAAAMLGAALAEADLVTRRARAFAELGGMAERTEADLGLDYRWDRDARYDYAGQQAQEP